MFNESDPYPEFSFLNVPEGFKDPTGLTKFLRVLLVLGVILSAIALWSGWLEYEMLADAKAGSYPSEAQANSNDTRQAVIGFVQFGVFIFTFIVFMVWIHRANHNARKLGTEGMKFSPGWAVGWFFIPIANLWKPYQAMKEIWKASKYSSPDWKNQQADPILGWWWALWIISNTLGRASFRMSMRAEEVHELIRASMTTLISDAISIPLNIIAIVLVGKIFHMQISRLEKMV